MSLLARMVHDEGGQTLVEYALLAGILSIAAIAIIPGVGSAVVAFFSRVPAAFGQ